MMNKKEICVAILDNSMDHSIYQPVKHWASFLEVSWRSFRAKEGEFPDLKEPYTHIILTGSEASILDRSDWVYREIDLVQAAVDRNLSVLGSCYGHQVLALALAGPQHVRRCPTHEIGWFPIRVTKESSIMGKEKVIYAFSSHFDEVCDLDENFTILSESDKCEIQAFQWKEKSVWGLQFHPEIDILEATLFIKASAAKGDKRAPMYGEALKSRPRDSGLIHAIIKNFIG